MNHHSQVPVSRRSPDSSPDFRCGGGSACGDGENGLFWSKQCQNHTQCSLTGMPFIGLFLVQAPRCNAAFSGPKHLRCKFRQNAFSRCTTIVADGRLVTSKYLAFIKQYILYSSGNLLLCPLLTKPTAKHPGSNVILAVLLLITIAERSSSSKSL